MLKRVVNVVEALAVLAIVVFVVALFANEPDAGGGGAAVGGEAIYAENCASCHGADGEGGRGPQLSDGAAVDNFPDVEDQVAVVADGEGRMPSFQGRLTEEQITEVVDYTRNL